MSGKDKICEKSVHFDAFCPSLFRPLPNGNWQSFTTYQQPVWPVADDRSLMGKAQEEVEMCQSPAETALRAPVGGILAREIHACRTGNPLEIALFSVISHSICPFSGAFLASFATSGGRAGNRAEGLLF
jgi:hypothetical protein